MNRALRSGLTTPLEEDDDDGGGGGGTGGRASAKSKKMAPTLSIGRLWLASLGGKVIVTNLTFTTLSSSIHIKRVVIIMRWWKGLWCVGKIRTAEPFGDPTYPLQYRYVVVQLGKDCFGLLAHPPPFFFSCPFLVFFSRFPFLVFLFSFSFLASLLFSFSLFS